MVGRTLIEAAKAVSLEYGVPPPEANADPNEYWRRVHPTATEQNAPDL
ncbi:MAG TPA: hypothetical protein VMW16_02320 [Sedimentisphaerales bacterium]|nr:hypothetical protein [Sedimentisphaerales bacterium]